MRETGDYSRARGREPRDIRGLPSTAGNIQGTARQAND
jgi:hypothetical protein